LRRIDPKFQPPRYASYLDELGARGVASVAEACEGEVVITMLADDDAASDIVFGEGGVLGYLPRGAIHLSMSTISVALSKRLAQAHERAGQRFVAAPVFGRPEMAAAGKLFIVAAGDPATIAVCQPLFRAMGQKTCPIAADPSAANLVKLSGNFLQASAIEALGEALALIGKKTSASRWPRPTAFVCRCRSKVYCMTDFCASLPAVATSWIGRPSAGSLLKMRARFRSYR
jgi:3-hydroxyisobutyrate dehydrogenase-like beta-hydroxyacid dehydrogenase